jgi:DMSO/TMAO reductase YedYZ molybdopterin-dependent catalytic subunit
VSTATWRGALLSDVLALARPSSQGVDVRFTGADHGAYHLQPILPETDRSDLTFERALPVGLAADPAADILLAYEMNGQPLGPDHGAPVRLVVPHWYAVASVKWLRRIDVLTEGFTGEFQTGHYIFQWPDRPEEPVALMRVRARITDPAPGSTIGGGSYTVRGKAWSGEGPVTRVEVSLTGEGDWQPAQLAAAAGPYMWQDWTFVWDTPAIGRHTIRARATDAAGNVQPDVPPWNRLGYGNNAIEVIFVDRH